MLTLAKLQTYERFGGDLDGYVRMRGHGDVDPSGITEADWTMIDRLRQALHLVASGRAAASFRLQTEQTFQAVTVDEPTREALRKLAETSR